MPRGAALLTFLALLGAAGCGSRDSAGPAAEVDGPAGRVILLGLDGVDPEVVGELMDRGLLPSFRRLREEGVLGKLRSAEPLLSPVIWTTIATGRAPLDHGITDFVTEGTEGETLPVTSRMRRTSALWNVASEADRSVGVVGWWATWPAEAVTGEVVSDRTCLHFLLADEEPDLELPGLVYPPEAVEEIAALVRLPESVGSDELREFARIEPEELARPFDFEDPLGHLRWAIATARTYSGIGWEIWRRREPDLLLVYVEAVDTVSHLFGHLYGTSGWSGELAEQVARYGGAVEGAYRLADEIVGQALVEADERTTVVVVSDHGFSLGEIPEDPRQTLHLRGVSEEAHRLDGIVGLWGRGVRRGSPPAQASIFDVAPTVLALLDLPASEEMPGRVWSEALSVPFPEERVASYERPGGEATSQDEPGLSAAEDQELVRKLEALGYLGGGRGGEHLERNEAILALREGRYREAARALRRLVAERPGDASLHSALGAALAGMGRREDAERELARALELDPSHVGALFNRGLLRERAGETGAAIADFRSALRYDSDHRPSREALERLGVAAEPTAVSEPESRAALLLRQAQDSARRGDYSGALALLDEAEEAVPGSAVVFQYRANVAYLAGDRPGAIEALERALEIEPDNALFRKNLDRLRREAELP